MEITVVVIVEALLITILGILFLAAKEKKYNQFFNILVKGLLVTLMLSFGVAIINITSGILNEITAKVLNIQSITVQNQTLMNEFAVQQFWVIMLIAISSIIINIIFVRFKITKYVFLTPSMVILVPIFIWAIISQSNYEFISLIIAIILTSTFFILWPNFYSKDTMRVTKGEIGLGYFTQFNIWLTNTTTKIIPKRKSFNEYNFKIKSPLKLLVFIFIGFNLIIFILGLQNATSFNEIIKAIAVLVIYVAGIFLILFAIKIFLPIFNENKEALKTISKGGIVSLGLPPFLKYINQKILFFAFFIGLLTLIFIYIISIIFQFEIFMPSMFLMLMLGGIIFTIIDYKRGMIAAIFGTIINTFLIVFLPYITYIIMQYNGYEAVTVPFSDFILISFVSTIILTLLNLI